MDFIKTKPLKHLMASATWVLLSVFSLSATQAADHVDGPVTTEHPVADISDLFAFPSPKKPGHLVIAMDVYPFVPSKGHFSDKVTYSFALKRVKQNGTGIHSAFVPTGDEFRFNCDFITPHKHNDHKVSCKAPNNVTVTRMVDRVSDETTDGIQLFAGRRSDSFIFPAEWFTNFVTKGDYKPSPEPSKTTRLNVLSIVIEFDLAAVLPAGEGNLFAVVAETATQDSADSAIRQIDRMGRPEITNGQLVRKAGEEDLRDAYNRLNTFALIPEENRVYQQRLLDNLHYFDGLDGATDWLPGWDETMANLLANDYLVVDAAKPFTNQSYFDIENSMLRSQPHTRSGGRVPNDYVINALLTTLVNGGHGPDVAAVHVGGPPQLQFPYLGEPKRGLVTWVMTFFANNIAGKQSNQFERH